MSPTGKKSLTSLLHRAGFRKTASRLELLSVLQKVKIPMKVDDIAKKLKTKPNKVTVYRALKELKEAGIVRQIDFQHNHAHYEFADLTEHHHLICTHCGKVEDVHHCDIENMRKVVLAQSKHFGAIQQHSLEFYGVCKSCAVKESRKN